MILFLFIESKQSPTLTTSHNGDMCSSVDASSARPYVINLLSTWNESEYSAKSIEKHNKCHYVL